MTQTFNLILAGNRPVRVDARTVSHCLLREVQMNDVGPRVCVLDRIGGYQDAAVVKPMAGLDRQISYGPRLVIEVDLIDRSNIAVDRADRALM